MAAERSARAIEQSGELSGQVTKHLDDLNSRIGGSLDNLNYRINVEEKRHHRIANDLMLLGKAIEICNTKPDAMWVFSNRQERMDATLPFFDKNRRHFHMERYRFASEYVSGHIIADIACGTGYGTKLMVQEGKAKKAVGVDISAEAIRYAKKEHADRKAEFICANGSSTGLRARRFDMIVSFETLEHVEDDQKLLAEFARLLKPEGILIISTPNAWPLTSSPYHVREYDRKSFKAVLERNFRIKTLFNQNSGTDSPLNHGQAAGIIPTTPKNQGLAECYLALCEKK